MEKDIQLHGKISQSPNSISEQTIGKYEGRERHSRMCLASGNADVFHRLIIT